MRVPDAHLFSANGRRFLLSVPRGLIHELDDDLAAALDRLMAFGEADRIELFMAAAGFRTGGDPGPVIEGDVPLRAFSLALSAKCNLGCAYCYADGGAFGGSSAGMPLDVALASVDRLLKGAAPGERVSLAFLGGEPLVSRAVLRQVTDYAVEKAVAAAVDIAFALTTNGTLVTAEDAAFFGLHRFTVTVSIDGDRGGHDLLRPFKSGRGSYDRVTDGIRLLLAPRPRRHKVTARVSVTPRNMNLPETLGGLAAMGVDSVQFSPVLKSPSGAGEVSGSDFDLLLQQMIGCGRAFEAGVKEGRILPFSNLISTLARIHAGLRDSYPCGAGGGYLGVSSDGGLFSCHRFVGDDAGAMGDLADGIDRQRRAKWLEERNVGRQEPCRSCWARHLCGGGCHHEAIHRGRPACDYIRGWLHYCLQLYVTLLKGEPWALHRMFAPEAQHAAQGEA